MQYRSVAQPIVIYGISHALPVVSIVIIISISVPDNLTDSLPSQSQLITRSRGAILIIGVVNSHSTVPP